MFVLLGEISMKKAYISMNHPSSIVGNFGNVSMPFYDKAAFEKIGY